MGLRLLGWAMVLIVLDPTLNSFDVLPDALGWALLLIGLLDLRRRTPELGHAWLTCWAGLAASSVSLALFFSEVSRPWATTLSWLAEAAAWWALAWWLLTGLATLVLDVDRDSALAARRLAAVLVVVALADLGGRVAALVFVLVHGRFPLTPSLVGTAATGLVTGAALAGAVFVLHAATLPWARVPATRVVPAH